MSNTKKMSDKEIERCLTDAGFETITVLIEKRGPYPVVLVQGKDARTTKAVRTRLGRTLKG